MINFFSPPQHKGCTLLVDKSQIGRAVFALMLASCSLGNSYAQEVRPEATKADRNGPRVTARLFWQDGDDQSIQSGDVIRDSGTWKIQKHPIAGLPKLDPEKQSLVQMRTAAGVVFVGVRDTSNGDFQSGWIALNSGVEEEEHGNHSHWHYEQKPSTIAFKLDAEQGNPAHMYEYDGSIFMANDKKNGFTILSPKTFLKHPSNSSSRFVSGGGGHITIAAVDHRVAYATWTDRDGENKGRVDVVGIESDKTAAGYSIRLPSGGLHGATACAGKVFFAPSDGVCWVQADVNLSSKPENVEVHWLSLGEDSQTGKPYRTGAFESHGNNVLFVTGAAKDASLCWIDATAPKPSVVKIPMPLESGLAWTTPRCVRTFRGNKQYALMFAERKGSGLGESLAIVDLDPNSDGNYADAVLAKSIPVGPSKIEGHSGHHDVCFGPRRRWAFISNPGEGSLWVLSLEDLEIQAKIQVSGTPTHVLAVGG